MNDNAVPIQYRDFYDVPRMFIVAHGGVTYLFDASFDEVLDDYPDIYTVSVLPPLNPEDFSGSWASLPARAIRRLSSVSVVAVPFDPTRRQAIEQSFLDTLIHPKSVEQHEDIPALVRHK